MHNNYVKTKLDDGNDREYVRTYIDENNCFYTTDGLIDGITKFTKIVKDKNSQTMNNVEMKYNLTIPSKNGFDIKKALEFGQKFATTKSRGICAKAVRLMLEAGGLNTTGRPKSAWQYVFFLPNIGFKHIKSLYGKNEQASWSMTAAQPGDIAVMSHGEHGHICMFTGKQWLSDFPQNNMWPYSGDGICNIFRFQ